MKRILVAFALALPLAAQQGFDFKSLDKLSASAKESTNITLEGQTLKLAANFLGDDKDAAALKSLVANLKSIHVRTLEFDRDGMYSQADLEPLRAYLRGPQWSKAVDVKESGETSEVFFKTGEGHRLGGVAVIDAEPRELTIVYIEGSISIDDVAKLSGNFDIPDLDALRHGTGNGGKSNAKGKKNE